MSRIINGLSVINDYKENLQYIKKDNVLKNMDEYHMYNLALEATKADWVVGIGRDLVGDLVDILNYPIGDFVKDLPSAISEIAEAIREKE